MPVALIYVFHDKFDHEKVFIRQIVALGVDGALQKFKLALGADLNPILHCEGSVVEDLLLSQDSLDIVEPSHISVFDNIIIFFDVLLMVI